MKERTWLGILLSFAAPCRTLLRIMTNLPNYYFM